jgi:hypothetical protein
LTLGDFPITLSKMPAQTIFISYRTNSGSAHARLLKEELQNRYHYSVFMYVDEQVAGPWQARILSEIQRRTHFLFLLTDGALDGCIERGDIFRQEFETAERSGANIIPVICDADLGLLRRSCPESMNVFEFEYATLSILGSFRINVANIVESFIEPWIANRQRGPQPINLPQTSLNTAFKGRDEILSGLRRTLSPTTRPMTEVNHVVKVHGSGGIGKTRLAIEYAWQSRNLYSALLFVNADSPRAFLSGLASLGAVRHLNARFQSARKEGDRIGGVLDWLENNPVWLLIIDNVDNPEAATEVFGRLASLRNGHIIITGRWTDTLDDRVIHLGPLDNSDARDLILERTEKGRIKELQDVKNAKILSKLVGNLPFQLAVAVAAISKRSTIGTYIRNRRAQTRLIASIDGLTDYGRSAAVTYETTIAELSPEAVSLLHLFAWFSPDPIPVPLIQNGLFAIWADAIRLAGGNDLTVDEYKIAEALNELINYSMVEPVGPDILIHSVLQEVLRHRMRTVQKQWARLAIRVLHLSLASMRQLRKQLGGNELVSHVLAFAERAGKTEFEFKELSTTLTRVIPLMYAELDPGQLRTLVAKLSNLSPATQVICVMFTRWPAPAQKERHLTAQLQRWKDAERWTEVQYIRLGLAFQWFFRGEVDMSEVTFRGCLQPKALSKTPPALLALPMLATLALYRGDFLGAIKFCARSLRITPKGFVQPLGQSLWAKGEAVMRKGRFKTVYCHRAIALFKKSLRVARIYPAAKPFCYASLALAYAHLGKTTLARAKCRASRNSAGGTPFESGVAAFYSGEVELALPSNNISERISHLESAKLHFHTAVNTYGSNFPFYRCKAEFFLSAVYFELASLLGQSEPLRRKYSVSGELWRRRAFSLKQKYRKYFRYWQRTQF